MPSNNEIAVPGDLPSGITEKEYLSGKISVLRNRNLANVFYRLGFVEIFGTGIARIKQLYKESLRKPDFEVTENTIKIMLPVYEENMNLTEDEKKVYNILSKTMLKSMSEIAPYVSFGKSKTAQLLKDMQKKGVVEVEGRGRGTKYIIKSMERTARFHAFLNNVSLFTNIRMHLIWNDKFHTAHVHWCDIARVCEKIS